MRNDNCSLFLFEMIFFYLLFFLPSVVKHFFLLLISKTSRFHLTISSAYEIIFKRHESAFIGFHFNFCIVARRGGAVNGKEAHS